MGTKGRAWLAGGVVLVVTSLAILAVAASTAPAGNRTPLSELLVSPGPASPTSGKTVALTARLENRQSSMFTDITFRLPIPAGATFETTDCASYELVPVGSSIEFDCSWGHQLPAGQTATVTIALKTPDSGSLVTAAGAWRMKEGSQTKGGGPDTLPTNAGEVSLLAKNDPLNAADFATAVCTDPATPTLATLPIGPGNPMSTSVCAPNLPTVPITGIAASIEERDRTNADPGITQVSDICLPEPDSDCGSASVPFQFSPMATFVFTIDNKALPCPAGSRGGCAVPQITKIFHNGVLVPPTSTDPDIVSITFNQATKVTTAVVESSTNGHWTGG